MQISKITFASYISPLSIIVPPALIISQGMGTITALAWVSIASLSWPEDISIFNNNLFFISLVCAGVVSVLGGGDTASAANRFSVSGNFSHISTGGGASLELLSGKDLPAINALNS